MEMPLIPVLAQMEYEGVKIDPNQLLEYSKILTHELSQIEAKARTMADEPTLNLSSPRQIGIVLYEKMNLNPRAKKNQKENYHTDEETLMELIDKHPIINAILEFRATKKLLSTYIDPLPALINPDTGKIHTTFNQALTSTGRLSSVRPNLQNIPIRTEKGREIRKAFVPCNPDGFIVSADYSQIELRLIAELSQDEGLLEDFRHGQDIHASTASKIFKISPLEVTREQRRQAKVANFGIIYGISAFGLSQRLNIPRGEAKILIDEYFKNYPKVKEYMDNAIKRGKEQGYVETLFGRKRYLPDINSKNQVVRGLSERNAINAPIQGSAADIIKMAMINVHNRIKKEKLKSVMVLQVHDELVFDVISSELDIMLKLVKEEMENVYKLSIPLIVDCSYGKNWLEAH
jgi:DNA polymerase-1